MVIFPSFRKDEMTKSRIERDNLGDFMNKKLACVDNEGRQVSKETISQSKCRGYNMKKVGPAMGRKRIRSRT